MAVEKLHHVLPSAKKRPDSALSSADVLCLEIYHFTGLTFAEVYKMVYNARDKSEATIRKASKDLIDSNDAQTYLEDRRSQVEKFIVGVSKGDDQEDDYINEDGSFKQDVIRKMGSKIAKAALSDGADGKRFLEIASNVIMKQQNMKAEGEPPLRVLAEQCHSCRYRIHIEENYDDVCKICRYQIDSETKHNHKKQLEWKSKEKSSKSP